MTGTECLLSGMERMVKGVSKVPSTPFSNGTEFEVFKQNWCYRCRAHKERPDGFPEFPENGGCPIEDATENARFDISKFPSDMLLTLRDATTDKPICWHYCLRFDSPNEDVQFRYFDMLKRAMFKEKGR